MTLFKCYTHTLNSSANISLFSGDGYTARPWGSSLFLPTDFLTITVSPRPPSSVSKINTFGKIARVRQRERGGGKSSFTGENPKMNVVYFSDSLGTVWVRISSIFGVGDRLVSSTILYILCLRGWSLGGLPTLDKGTCHHRSTTTVFWGNIEHIYLNSHQLDKQTLHKEDALFIATYQLLPLVTTL